MSLWRAIAALLYRERCVACRAWNPAPLCAACEAAWPPAPSGLCFGCGAFVGGYAAGESGAAPGACDACCDRPPAFRAVVAAGSYRGVAREALHALKYRGRRGVARLLARRLSASADFPAGPWLVVPVPLHRTRRRERGYNQALVLARALGRARRWPVSDCLRRPQATIPQSALGRAGRLENLAGAFVATRRLAGARVLLVDDILTTGATAHWAAEALRAAGAAEIAVAVVARTPAPGH